jgi:hypothetical protein
MSRFALLVALATALLAPRPVSAAPAPAPAPAVDADGFRSLFDGHSLAGWGSPDPSWWSVEDGAITGRITRDRPCGTNQYLVWKEAELADFELKLQSRLSGEGGINNGFQFRSRVLPDGDVAGYQMDNNLQTDWLVRLYDEFGRHTLAWRGQQTHFDTDGRRTTTDLPGAGGPAWFQLGDWHEYHLVCTGPRLVLHVDGRLAARVEDHDRRRAEAQGALALQLHSGPPTVVQFKDIRLKVLRPAEPPAPAPARAEDRRLALLESAEAWWDLGVGGHMRRHPLRYVGSLDDFEFNVRPDGPGARPESRVTVLRAGWFDAGRELSLTNRQLTLWIRARDPEGKWQGTLLARQPGTNATTGFALQARGDRLRFEVGTDHGVAHVDLPIASLDRLAWHDFVARDDGRFLEVYCDGALAARREWRGGRLRSPEAPLLVGAQPNAGKATHGFRGELEAAAVWPRALRNRELRLLVPRPPPPR